MYVNGAPVHHSGWDEKDAAVGDESGGAGGANNNNSSKKSVTAR